MRPELLLEFVHQLAGGHRPGQRRAWISAGAVMDGEPPLCRYPNNLYCHLLPTHTEVCQRPNFSNGTERGFPEADGCLNRGQTWALCTGHGENGFLANPVGLIVRIGTGLARRATHFLHKHGPRSLSLSEGLESIMLLPFSTTACPLWPTEVPSP